MLKIKAIQNFAFQHNLWTRGAKIIIGVSGGPDSVCLLDIFAKLAKKYEFQFIIAHVNYNLRGLDSEADEKFVRDLGKKYGFEVRVLKPKKEGYKGNLEEALRDIRYTFFETLRKEEKFDFIAVAHNQDDQAETVLMRIIRGSGLNGLSAMKPRSGQVIRPLLKTSRSELLAYLKSGKIKFRTDKTNFDKKFTRNKIRHGLLPYLQKNFNASIKANLSELASVLADDYAFIDFHSEKFVKTAYQDKKAQFQATNFLKMPKSIQRHALKLMAQKISSGSIENRKIEEIVKLIASSKNKSSKASVGGLKITKNGDRIEIFC